MRQAIEVIAHCEANGALQPLRFRYETPDHHLVTVSVDRVISRNEIVYVGIEAFVFLCRGTEGGQKRMFELRYEVRSHTWALQNIVY